MRAPLGRWGGEGTEGLHPRPLGLGVIVNELDFLPGGRVLVGRPLLGLRAQVKIRV